MTQDQKAAYVMAQAVMLQNKTLGMHAENLRLTSQDQQPKYGEADFEQIADEYGLDHNALITLFHET